MEKKTKEQLDRSYLALLDELEVHSNFVDVMPEVWGGQWSVDSEIGKLRAVLMRRPGKEIDNITLPPALVSMHDTLNPDAMRREFDAIKKMYEDNGVKVYLIDDEDVRLDCPNNVFCRDLVNGSPNGAIISRMGISVRSPEAAAAAKTLGKIGVPIAKTINANGTFEGACLIWVDKETVIIGHGTRSNDEGCRQVVDELRNQGVKNFIWVEIPRNGVHLDGFIGVADIDVVLLFPSITPNNVYDEFKKRGFRIVEIPTWEEQALAANFVALEPGKIAMCAGFPKTKALLEEAGVEVIEVKVDEIRRAGGAIHCMTAFLQRDSIPVYPVKELAR
ncbi:MAG TPA: arginine deiminase family protein [Clostridia bacterium]|nr:arginine deiminase family protein [Clostridia bacterium]